MKFTYDPEADAVSIFWGGTVAESDEIAPGVIVDLDTDGKIIGVEILDASKQIEYLKDDASDITTQLERDGESHPPLLQPEKAEAA